MAASTANEVPRTDAARHPAHRHHRRGALPRLRFRRHRAAPPCIAAGRLSAGRRGAGALHARLRRRPIAGERAGRDRRHPADVRRRPALLAERPVVGAADRGAGRHRADRRGDDVRHRARLFARLADRRRHHLRPGAVRRQHRGAAARPAGAAHPQHRARAHRRRLADRRRPRHGADAGAAAGAGADPQRQPAGRSGRAPASRWRRSPPRWR